MRGFSVNAHRHDPYRNFKFRVIIDRKPVVGVTRVSPLRRITQPVHSRDGGDSSRQRVAPGLSSFEPVVIERGLTHDATFEQWANQVYNPAGDAGVSLKDFRKDVVIQLLNLQGTVVMSFKVHRCWVAEYQALPELDANRESVAIERIVLEHEGWERDQEVGEPAET